MKLIEKLQQSKEKRDQEQLQYHVQEQQQQLEADLLETKRELSKAKRELEEAMYPEPGEGLDTGAIIELQEDVASLERGIEALEALKEKLF